MNRTILFSPVGGTDPISLNNWRDGSLLHICRVYKPTDVVMYMSKEILENHKKDNRYLYCLDKLSELLDFKMDYKIIERQDLENVQEFDPYYKDFKMELEKIVNKMDETDKLYLNISSGTPAMKSALLILQNMGEIDCDSIQVSTPAKKMNEHTHVGYDVETLWEGDEDNNEEFINRCSIVNCPNLSLIKKEELIKQQINDYDYHAAVNIASTIDSENRKRYWDYLKLAEARAAMNFTEVDRIIDKTGYSPLPYKSGDERKYFEYALNLKLKLNRKENADFIRAITPIVVDLFQLILKEQLDIDINDYCSIEDGGGLKWDQYKLLNTELINILQSVFYNDFKYGFVYSIQLLKIIKKQSEDKSLKATCERLRFIEDRVRNIAAHQIIAITDRKLKELTKNENDKKYPNGYTLGNIMKLIEDIFDYTSIKVKSEFWNSFEIMNEKIISLI